MMKEFANVKRKNIPFFIDEKEFIKLSYKYQNLVSIIKFDRAISKKMYASADIFVMPSRSEPCGLAQMIACSYGTVPIVRSVGGLYDSIKPYWIDNGEMRGNGFTFANYSPYELEERTCAAIELWNNYELRVAFVNKIMRIDFSWKNSAEKYLEMYAPLWKK